MAILGAFGARSYAEYCRIRGDLRGAADALREAAQVMWASGSNRRAASLEAARDELLQRLSD